MPADSNQSGTKQCDPVDISIIIVNWNSASYVRQCLRTIFRHTTGLKFEVIVVDNASFDGCQEMLQTEFPTVLYVQTGENIGFGRANNFGARRARGEFLVLLNPDTEIASNALFVLHQHARQLRGAGVLGCRLVNANGSTQTSCLQSFPTVLNQLLDCELLRRAAPRSKLWGMAPLYCGSAEPEPAEAISGACMVIRRDVFAGIGGFTPEYFMYGEDLDLCYKAHAAQLTNYYIPTVEIRHIGGGSSKHAPSEFSIVSMRKSVHLFIRLRRGAVSAAAYRATTLLAALLRLALIGPLLLLGRSIVQHGVDSYRKWTAVLVWSIIGA